MKTFLTPVFFIALITGIVSVVLIVAFPDHPLTKDEVLVIAVGSVVLVGIGQWLLGRRRRKRDGQNDTSA